MANQQLRSCCVNCWCNIIKKVKRFFLVDGVFRLINSFCDVFNLFLEAIENRMMGQKTLFPLWSNTHITHRNWSLANNFTFLYNVHQFLNYKYKNIMISFKCQAFTWPRLLHFNNKGLKFGVKIALIIIYNQYFKVYFFVSLWIQVEQAQKFWRWPLGWLLLWKFKTCYTSEMGPDLTRACFLPAVNKWPTRLWPGYFLTRQKEKIEKFDIFRGNFPNPNLNHKWLTRPNQSY